jgi:hypothetical protein
VVSRLYLIVDSLFHAAFLVLDNFFGNGIPFFTRVTLSLAILRIGLLLDRKVVLLWPFGIFCGKITIKKTIAIVTIVFVMFTVYVLLILTYVNELSFSLGKIIHGLNVLALKL